MTNAFFNHDTPVPRNVLARASLMNTIFAAIAAGFDLISDPVVASQGRFNVATDSGTANTYVLTMPKTVTSLVEGLEVVFKPLATNTGPSTINVDGLGAVAVKRRLGSDLVAGDISASSFTTARYVGSQFQLIDAMTVTSTATTGFMATVLAAADAGGARTLLDAQQLNANLTALAGLTGAADKIAMFDGAGSLTLQTLTAFARTLLDDADAASFRTTLGMGALALLSTIGTSEIDDNAVTLDKIAHLSAGDLLLFAATGIPSALAKGTANQILTMGASLPEWADKELLLHVREQQTAGTNGGGFTSGAWQTRVLNTALTNDIPGASLASNQIILPAGTYDAIGRAPARAVNLHKAKLVDVTNTVDLIIGSASQSNASVAGTWESHFMGRFTLAGTASIEVQHQCETTAATTGFGIAAGFSEVEVYTDIQIRKVA